MTSLAPHTSPPPPRTRPTPILESRLRSLAFAALSLAVPVSATACLTEPADDLGAEGAPDAAGALEAAEDLEADEDLEAARSAGAMIAESLTGGDGEALALVASPLAAVNAPVTL